MPLDALIKKFFPVIIGGVLALIAYFQASGVVELAAGSALALEPDELAAMNLRPRPTSSRFKRVERPSAQPIIDNNVFDYETDLNPPPPEPEASESEIAGPPKVDFSDPLGAAPCADIEVNIVTESSDPTWSLAVLKAPGDDKPALRRVGDMAGDYEVAYIGYNRIEASPAVWLVNEKEGELCQAFLFGVQQQQAAARQPEKPEPKEPERPRSRGPASVPSEIADKIEKVSDTEFNVDRAVVDNILENQAQLMRSARIVPEKGKDGKTVGIRLFGVRPDTLLGTLGLQNGDRLETINGFNMGNPEDALNAYARLRTANKLSVKVTRRGKPMNIDFNIK